MVILGYIHIRYWCTPFFFNLQLGSNHSLGINQSQTTGMDHPNGGLQTWCLYWSCAMGWVPVWWECAGEVYACTGLTSIKGWVCLTLCSLSIWLWSKTHLYPWYYLQTLAGCLVYSIHLLSSYSFCQHTSCQLSNRPGESTSWLANLLSCQGTVVPRCCEGLEYKAEQEPPFWSHWLEPTQDNTFRFSHAWHKYPRAMGEQWINNMITGSHLTRVLSSICSSHDTYVSTQKSAPVNCVRQTHFLHTCLLYSRNVDLLHEQLLFTSYHPPKMPTVVSLMFLWPAAKWVIILVTQNMIEMDNKTINQNNKIFVSSDGVMKSIILVTSVTNMLILIV